MTIQIDKTYLRSNRDEQIFRAKIRFRVFQKVTQSIF